MIEQETQFTLSQFKKKFGITNYQWKNRKEDLLEHLKTFFDMDVLITDNNNYTFIVYEQLFEYEPLPRKVNEAIWCYCDDDKLNYIPLDKEQLEFLYSLFGGQ